MRAGCTSSPFAAGGNSIRGHADGGKRRAAAVGVLVHDVAPAGHDRVDLAPEADGLRDARTNLLGRETSGTAGRLLKKGPSGVPFGAGRG